MYTSFLIKRDRQDNVLSQKRQLRDTAITNKAGIFLSFFPARYRAGGIQQILQSGWFLLSVFLKHFFYHT